MHQTINYFARVVKRIARISVIRIGAFYLAMFQLMATNYELQLNVAILERNSVESLIGDDKLDQAIKGLGRAQRERVPQKPVLFFPWTIFSFNPQPVFKERLHEEIVVALQEYSDELPPDTKYSLNLSHADLTEADLHDANLSKILAFKAKMTNKNLRNANLTKAILNASEMVEAKLGKAKLRDAALYAATLTKAELMHADLSKSNFQKADLTDSKLDSATVLEVDFQGANLTGATLTGIRSWRNIKSIKNANIRNVFFKDTDDALDFRSWALSEEQGAVEMAEDEWRYRNRANFHPPKNWNDWKARGFQVDSKGVPIENFDSK